MRKPDSQQARVILGGTIVAVGVAFLLRNLGVIEFSIVGRLWPLVLVLIGALKLTQARHTSGYVVGGALMMVGALMTLNNLGVIRFGFRDWWPLLMIFGGFVLLARGRMQAAAAGSVDAALRAQLLDATVVMGGNRVRNESPDFRGGEATAVMGGLEINLRQATIASEAVLQVFALMGGIDIRVPADWSVEIRGMPILGGIEDKTVPPMNPTRRLIVEGYAIMGGVELKN